MTSGKLHTKSEKKNDRKEDIIHRIHRVSWFYYKTWTNRHVIAPERYSEMVICAFVSFNHFLLDYFIPLCEIFTSILWCSPFFFTEVGYFSPGALNFSGQLSQFWIYLYNWITRDVIDMNSVVNIKLQQGTHFFNNFRNNDRKQFFIDNLESVINIVVP